jgi:ketosteroid isomerase-like protein
LVSSNLDLVRSLYAAWERGDWSSADWAHPEIEFLIADGPAPGRWTGPAGIAEGTRDALSAWKTFRIDAERVLGLVRFGGRGRASGVDLEQMRTEGAHIFHVRDGKVTRVVLYFNRERALADLGLRE